MFLIVLFLTNSAAITPVLHELFKDIAKILIRNFFRGTYVNREKASAAAELQV
jgi:hypothetical protein